MELYWMVTGPFLRNVKTFLPLQLALIVSIVAVVIYALGEGLQVVTCMVEVDTWARDNNLFKLL